MAELADAPDLGSGGLPVQVQVLLPAPGRAWTQAASRARFFYFAFSLAFVAGIYICNANSRRSKIRFAPLFQLRPAALGSQLAGRPAGVFLTQQYRFEPPLPRNLESIRVPGKAFSFALPPAFPAGAFCSPSQGEPPLPNRAPHVVGCVFFSPALRAPSRGPAVSLPRQKKKPRQNGTSLL